MSEWLSKSHDFIITGAMIVVGERERCEGESDGGEPALAV